jgi:hypothetical protein
MLPGSDVESNVAGIQRMAEQGPIEMRNLKTVAGEAARPESMKVMKRRTRAIGTAMAAALVAGLLTAVAPARAQQQPELSQKSVETLMDYAWAITPDRFTKPNGVTVEIDRGNRKDIEVPVDTAREIIRVGRLSAHAQVCDLKEEHATNFRTLMAREAIKKKWSEPQMVFMNQLHMVTVMLLTGQLKLIEREEGKEAAVSEEAVGKQSTCSAEQKAKVKEALIAYQKAGPTLAPAEATAAAPAPAATPASAPQPPAKK